MLISNTRLNSQDLSARASNSARLSLLKFGWTTFFDYPLTGAGAALIKVSHNIYLQILSSIGLIGFFAFINFIVRTMSNSFRTSYLEKIPLIVFLVFGLLNNSLSDFYLYFPLAFAYAIKSKIEKYGDNIN
jgi:O-antigen ligase